MESDHRIVPVYRQSVPGWLAVFALVLAACAPQAQPTTFRVTVAPTQNSAPSYTATPTASATPLATNTPTQTSTPTIEPTPGVQTLTPASPDGAPPALAPATAALSDNTGWSCDDFPCEDDIEGFLERIRVPEGFTLAHVGRLPGQPMQITYGRDGLLYATVLENGTRSGAVYRLNADGSAERYSGDFVSPLGLAFQPGSDVLYVSARMSLESGGGIWRVTADGEAEPVVTDLPCCLELIDNQPNGLAFGPDGYLYLGIGSLTDQAEPPPGRASNYVTPRDDEAAILRIHPHTGELEVYASGIRNPYDITFTSDGQMYATDTGIFLGPGDRLLAIVQGRHYGWPYYQERGCDNCPPRPPGLQIEGDLLKLRNRSLPRGLVAYTATQFPENYFDSLFVTLWNSVPDSQRVVRVDLARARQTAAYAPEPFITGLIRPIDVTLAPDGSLVVADYIYGHIWRVSYTG